MSLLHNSVVTYMCNVMLCFCVDTVLTRSKERWDEKTWGDCTSRREETRTSWAVPRGRCRHVWRVPQRKRQKFRRCHPNVRLICYLYLLFGDFERLQSSEMESWFEISYKKFAVCVSYNQAIYILEQNNKKSSYWKMGRQLFYICIEPPEPGAGFHGCPVPDNRILTTHKVINLAILLQCWSRDKS